MTKPYVYLTRKMPEEIVAPLADVCNVGMWDKEDVPVPREVLEKEMANASALFCNVSDQIDKHIIEKAPLLKVIATMAVGYNNIDVAYAQKQNIIVAHTPYVLTETTADLTFSLLMAAARRIPESMEVIKNGKWKAWAPFAMIGKDIYNATLGIIGMGRIGEAVARRAKGFSMNILYYNRRPKPQAEKALGAQYVSLNELLERSDFVCVLTPYTKETHHLIGEEQLRRMKKSAVLVNTSRGETVDEEALYRALKNGDIWNAGLDVFEKEPIDPTHPLLTIPKVVCLPHIGSASEATRLKMASMTTNHILQALSGKKPNHIVPNVE